MTKTQRVVAVLILFFGMAGIFWLQQHRAGKKVAPSMHGSVQRALPQAGDLTDEGKRP